MIAINKHSSKLKVWSFEIPGISYSGRCRALAYAHRSDSSFGTND